MTFHTYEKTKSQESNLPIRYIPATGVYLDLDHLTYVETTKNYKCYTVGMP